MQKSITSTLQILQPALEDINHIKEVISPIFLISAAICCKIFEHFFKKLLIQICVNLGGYEGPWIENFFIDKFSLKPLSYFGGIFPLFVQWSDYGLMYRNISESVLFAELRAALRPNILYITVSQSNHGLKFLMKSDPNLIVMSAGGDGNIAIPLIKGRYCVAL